jgi:hypothetical protein
MTDDLHTCFFRFLRTRESILFLLLGVVVYFNTYTYLSMLGIVIGIVLYVITEKSAHIAMHHNKCNPFYMTHRIHHSTHTPESGIPQWWLFGVYGLVTIISILLHRPFFSGLWIGVLCMLILYEWIHYLYHCDYTPRTRLGNNLRQHHLQHHVNPSTNFEVIIPTKEKNNV